jgi:hypothetical protein
MRTYAIGDRVSEAKFGDGTIQSCNEYHTVIDFDEHGVKTFSTALVRLSKATTAAPTKPVKAAKKSRKKES